MKKIITGFAIAFLTVLSIQPSNADPTYAVVDSNGNVTNIIVCGIACSGSPFGPPGGLMGPAFATTPILNGFAGPAGEKIVLQVAADPQTGENRGGFWNGPGTTTYNDQTGTFIVTNNSIVTNSITENINGSEVTSSATVVGGHTTSFTYEDTVGSKLLTRLGFVYGYSENTEATISVTSNSSTESLSFANRQTVDELTTAANNSNLSLLNSKINTLVRLLGGWVK